MAAAANTSRLTSAFLPTSEFRRQCRSSPWPVTQSQGTKRTVLRKIVAKVDLKPPPYALNALEPHISQETMEHHWGRHHRAYVDNLNEQIVGTELDEMTLNRILLTSFNKGDPRPMFNNAAEAWNHDFFWKSMKPGGGGKPSGELLELINRDFGSFEVFVNDFKSAAASQIGSGWTWLVYKANRLGVGNSKNPRPSEKDKKLVIMKTIDALNPLVWGYSPLLAIDVWEHAYYLDYENRKLDYISTFLDNLVSWKRVSSRLEAAKARAEEREKPKTKARKSLALRGISELELAKALARKRRLEREAKMLKQMDDSETN